MLLLILILLNNSEKTFNEHTRIRYNLENTCLMVNPIKVNIFAATMSRDGRLTSPKPFQNGLCLTGPYSHVIAVVLLMGFLLF